MALLSAPVFNAMPGMRRASQSLRNSMAFNYIAVLGAGAWGAALALTCARAGRRVTLWEHDPANAAQLAGKRESLFLPGVALDARIVIARDLAEAARAQAILLVVSAQAVRGVAQALAPLLAGHACGRLRQGHRTRQQEVHDRSDRRVCRKRGPSHFVWPKLCRRRGTRHAHRRHACGSG